MSLFEPMTIPTVGRVVHVEVVELVLHLGLGDRELPRLGNPHASTLSTARAAMSLRICRPSNSIRSAAS